MNVITYSKQKIKFKYKNKRKMINFMRCEFCLNQKKRTVKKEKRKSGDQ